MFNRHVHILLKLFQKVNTSDAETPKWAILISVWAILCYILNLADFFRQKYNAFITTGRELFMSELHLPHDHHHNTRLEETLVRVAQIEDFSITADAFKLLGDCSRLRIFWLLCHQEDCVLNISAMVQMSSPAVSHHLKQLKSGGLITSRREGKEVYYKASDSKQSKLLHRTIEQLMNLLCPESDLVSQ